MTDSALTKSGLLVEKTKVAEITSGRVDFELCVRVINIWTTPDRVNPSDIGAIHMIFIDKDRGKIQATIRKDLISRFKDRIEYGCAYVFEKFMVAKNDVTFRCSSHKYKLNFMRGTKVWKLTANDIPMNHFDFMPFQEIISKTNEDQMLDAIGHVVDKNALRETEKNGKKSKVLDITLEDLEGDRVHCTLWDEFAERMHRFLDGHDSSMPVVIILQQCKLKKFLGAMGISNSFYGSKLFLNARIPEVTDYVDRMNMANVELTQVVSQVSGPVVFSVADDLLQTPRMTIEELIESAEKCVASVLAVACEIDTNLSWFYQACSRCASRINYIGGQLYCEKCKMPRTAIPRFKVQLQVMDNTGSITFVMFDRIVSQVLGRTAQDLLDAMNNEEASNAYPQELDMFVDKRILFKVEITDANLYRNWRGYTVKKLSFDDDIINRFTTLHGIDSVDGCDGADYTQFTCDLDGDATFEGGGSSKHEEPILSDTTRTPASKPTGEEGSNVDGARSSTTKGSSLTGWELVDVDENQVSPPKQATSATPTSKKSGKKADKVVAAGSSPAKARSPCTRSMTSAEIGHVSPPKQAGKRSTNIDQGEIAAAKDTKMPCVKVEVIE
ncbi:replication protein A 70 kDa DNA-binding subunit [Trifolium repens]|nr:replication protein A 70 kDa DNA-binding subunit [Trifolium repens]